MANRVLAGAHNSLGYGLFVSKPNKNVLSATGNDLIYDSTVQRSGTVHQTSIITMSSGNATASLTISPTIDYIPYVKVNRVDGTNVYGEEAYFQALSIFPSRPLIMGMVYKKETTQTTVTVTKMDDDFQSTLNASSDEKFRIIVFRIPVASSLA